MKEDRVEMTYSNRKERIGRKEKALTSLIPDT
jgi:hypothetical protein